MDKNALDDDCQCIAEMHRPTKMSGISAVSIKTDEPSISQTPRRKRGRPRKTNGESPAQAKEILNIAIDMFAKQGYQSTTMSQIAAAAGYSQSSLYYWYKRKEDILHEIIKETGFSLHTAARISSFPDDKTAQLYAVIYSDVYMMCNLPCDFHNLEDVAEEANGTLGEFFVTYQQLLESIRLIIEDGIAQGEFIHTDSAAAVLDILSLNEGLQHRYHQHIRRKDESHSMIDLDTGNLFIDKTALARHAATVAIRMLAPDCIPSEIHKQAEANNWI